MFAGLVLVGDALPTRETRRGGLIVERDGGVWEVVEEGFEFLMKERKPVFDALVFAPSADRFVEGIVGASGAEFQTVVLAEAGDGSLIEDDLGDRGQFHDIELVCCALGGRVEAAGAVEHVSEEIEADWAALTRRVDVDDAAAERVIAGFHHCGALGEAHTDEEGAEGVFIDPTADAGGEGGLFQDAAGGQALGGGVERCQKDKAVRHAVDEAGECRHAGGGDIWIG